MERQGQPTRAGKGGAKEGKGRGCSLQCSQPPYAPRGLDQRTRAKAPCPRHPQCGSSIPIADKERRSGAHRRMGAPGWPPTRS